MSTQSFARVEQAFATPSPRHNQLLAALPRAEYLRLEPELEFAPLPVGRVVYASAAQSPHAYFPTSGIISVRSATANGLQTEIATTGREGLVGMATLLGGSLRAVVQDAGSSYRLDASLLTREIEHGSALGRLALRHTLALIAQIGQLAVCNRFHSVDQQLCRSILWSLDRMDSDELTMTHQSTAANLGVRRECVTHAAGRLQAAGLIEYHRGHVRVLDRSGLEARACECYGVVKREYGRLRPVASLGAERAREPRLRFAGGRVPAPPAESMPLSF